MLVGVLAVAGCGKSNTPASSTPTPRSSGQQISAIASSGSTCTGFTSGRLPALGQLRYTMSGSKVARVTPATFDYWVKVIPKSGPLTTLTLIASAHGAGSLVTATGGDVFSDGGSGGTCGPVSNSVSYSASQAKVTFAGTSGAIYLVQVHFTAAALVGQPLTPGNADVTISTAEVTGSSSHISLAAA